MSARSDPSDVTGAPTSHCLDMDSQESPSIESRLTENEDTVTRLREERADLEAELRSLNYGQDHLGNALQAMADVRRLLVKGTAEEISETRVRLNGALKRLVATIEIGVVGDMGGVSDKPLWANFQKLQDHLEEPMIPLTINFHQENRHLLIYAAPKNSMGFISCGVKLDEMGKIEQFRLGGHWSTLIKPEVLPALFG